LAPDDKFLMQNARNVTSAGAQIGLLQINTNLLAWRIQSYSRLRSSKVIDLGVNRKLISNLLIVINSNYGRIFYHFRDIAV